MPSKIVKVRLVRDGNRCHVPVPFDPKAEFGRVRAPVRVTLNGYTYRSTISSMRGVVFIPLRKSHRDAARLEGIETIEVTIELDDEKRDVKPPADFINALKAAPPAWDRWQELSFTHQREYVESIEEARKAETRSSRIEAAARKIGARPPRKHR